MVATGVVGVLALGGLPAGATVTERERYSDSYAFSYDDCGFPVEVEGVVSGVFHFRQGKNKDDQAFFVHDRFSYHEVHTNAETGEFFVQRGHAVFNETKATRVEGNIFEFRAIEAGQPFVIEDSEGHVVIRDRGNIRRIALFDTLGDSQPGGELVELVSEEIAGPHPGFFVDFCEIAESLIG